MFTKEFQGLLTDIKLYIPHKGKDEYGDIRVGFEEAEVVQGYIKEIPQQIDEQNSKNKYRSDYVLYTQCEIYKEVYVEIRGEYYKIKRSIQRGIGECNYYFKHYL